MNDPVERRKLAHANMSYSIQRIDLLIMSISGAGVYVVLEAMKYIDGKHLDVPLLLKIAGGCFVTAVIVNFLSQISGYKTNRFDFIACSYEIQSNETKNASDKNRLIIKSDRNDKKSDIWNWITNALNSSSFFIMAAGLVSLLYYFIFVFGS